MSELDGTKSMGGPLLELTGVGVNRIVMGNLYHYSCQRSLERQRGMNRHANPKDLHGVGVPPHPRPSLPIRGSPGSPTVHVNPWVCHFSCQECGTRIAQRIMHPLKSSPSELSPGKVTVVSTKPLESPTRLDGFEPRHHRSLPPPWVNKGRRKSRSGRTRASRSTPLRQEGI